MNRLIACLLFLAAALGSPAHAQNAPAPAATPAAAGQPLDRIVAVVDDGVILQSELDRAVANIRAQYAGRAEQLPPDDVLRRQVLERLIMMRLELQRAEQSGIKIGDRELDAAIASIAQRNNVSLEQMRAKLAQDGTDYDSFRNSVRDEMITQRLQQQFAQGQISVSDAEVDAALSSQANAGTHYHLANLQVAVPDGATPDQIATAQKKIEGIKALIDKGEITFAAAAARYSDGGNALEGGDLGWRGADEIPPAFARAIQSLQAGQLIGPVRGATGFQLVQLIETRDNTPAQPKMATEYHARHILVRTDGNAADDAKAKSTIDTLRARLAGGADFAALARSNSEDPNSAPRGGDLGWFVEDGYGEDFGKHVAALKADEISQPFRTNAGWHIVQLLGSRETDVGTQTRREQVRDMIGRRKLEEQWNRFLREMRDEAFVEIRLDGAAAASATSGGAG